MFEGLIPSENNARQTEISTFFRNMFEKDRKHLLLDTSEKFLTKNVCDVAKRWNILLDSQI